MICITPGAAWTIAYMVNSDFTGFEKEHYLFVALTDIKNQLARLNSAVNFVVYVALSQQFRGTLLKVLRCPVSWQLSEKESYTGQTEVTSH